MGRLISNNGDMYQGQWKNDKCHGWGKKNFHATGNVYEGEWVDDF